jgi:hypothetical protein
MHQDLGVTLEGAELVESLGHPADADMPGW